MPRWALLPWVRVKMQSMPQRNDSDIDWSQQPRHQYQYIYYYNDIINLLKIDSIKTDGNNQCAPIWLSLHPSPSSEIHFQEEEKAKKIWCRTIFYFCLVFCAIVSIRFMHIILIIIIYLYHYQLLLLCKHAPE